MQALANSYAFWVLAFLAIIAVYLLPTLVGIIRRVDRLALVFLVNLIGAPTGIGWLAAMILAFGPRRIPGPPPASWPPYPPLTSRLPQTRAPRSDARTGTRISRPSCPGGGQRT